jgi:hypothetical protein
MLISSDTNSLDFFSGAGTGRGTGAIRLPEM